MSETLQDAWLNSPKNKLGAKGEALAWALRKAWFASGNGKYGMLGFVQEHTTIDGHAPRPNTLTDLYKKIDADPEWYPGKLAGAAPGRPSAMTNTSKSVLARSAMAESKRGGECTYKSLIARNPNAKRNPETGEPVDKRAVYEVLKTQCYDNENNKDDTWAYQARNSKAALSDLEMEVRMQHADRMLDEVRHQASWYYRRLVWADVCSKILARTEKKATQLAMARRGRRRGSALAARATSEIYVPRETA